MAYLLDTNIISELVVHPSGPVAQRIREIDEGTVAASIIVAGELRFGAVKRGAPRLIQRVEAVLATLAVLPLEPPADAVYAELRAELERRGRLIGANDLWIAAHALALGRVLVTADAGFSRICGLKTENWLERAGEP